MMECFIPYIFKVVLACFGASFTSVCLVELEFAGEELEVDVFGAEDVYTPFFYIFCFAMPTPKFLITS